MKDEKLLFKAVEYLSNRLSPTSEPRDDDRVLIGYDGQIRELSGLLQRFVLSRESNSFLIIGPRGCGKTMALKSALEHVGRENSDALQALIQVKLNGLVITDDKIALNEIAWQLGVENAGSNRTFNSYGEHLIYVLETFGKEKPVMFVLEEFDLFAQHKNQTLLYNLFDICHSSLAPICVIGMTTRLDVLELLEKRVKSRFSHRQLHLLPVFGYDTYVHIFKATLKLPDYFGHPKFVASWNAQIDKLSEEITMQEVLKRQFRLTKSIRNLQSLMVVPLSRLSADHAELEAADFVDAARLKNSDSKSFILLGLSVLELCLIIAACHLTEIYNGEPLNFEMIFKEYSKFCQRRSSVPLFDRVVTLQAYEHLCNLELLLPADGVTQRVQREYQLVCLQVDRVHVLGALQRYPSCHTDIKHWAQSSMS